jgi:superoxide dismutase, Fe-Mn family
MIYAPLKLNYTFEALEPYIDKETMEIHFTKHYQTYINNLNAVLEKYPKINEMNLEKLLKNISTLEISETDQKFLKNNAGGYLNHNVYWQNMDPSNQMDEQLLTEIRSEFGSVEEMKKGLSDLSLKHFGSGWGWLARDEKQKLKIYTLPNQDSPYLLNHTPIIALDVWEHAYYLKYQNRRVEYIENWWKTVKII